ncbi:MAG: hypothetical protein ABJ004_11185 [Cyclobacteriaceae bacterium]
MSSWVGHAQSDHEPKWVVKGYVKDMVTFNFVEKDSTLIDNLIHHRLNFAWFPNENITAKAEFRTRIFNGDLVDLVPNYGSFIDVNNDYFDLSYMPVNSNKMIIHTMIDRLYVQWNKNDWEITAGRQRINWGVNLAWNPNDLFNTYSFYDFDYEERPGSDALRIKKYTGFASEMEFAIQAADKFEDLTAAYRYQINKWNYDFQFLGGVMENHLALGTGWAGNIENVGFKGEVTYLNHFKNDEDGLLASATVDYLFSSSLYLNGAVLFSSFGKNNSNFFAVDTRSNLDIKSLSPYRWSSFVQASYPIHPLVNIGLSSIVFPSDGSVFINPFLTYSIIQNLDLDFISQLYFGEGLDGKFDALSKVVYFRVKWSY